MFHPEYGYGWYVSKRKQSRNAWAAIILINNVSEVRTEINDEREWGSRKENVRMQLAYLVAETVDERSWVGGLLITDERGLPVDFRYVEPIKPTKLQKLIYGEALKRCLLLDAIAGTLIKAANPKVEWVFAGDPMLLELEGRISGKLVAVGNGEKVPLNEVGEWHQEEPGEIAMQVTETGPPVRLSFKARDDGETAEVAKDLAWLAGQLDFTEPLRRVGAALKEICSGTGE